MRRHFDSCNGAAESFVSCIPLFDGLVVAPQIVDLGQQGHTRSTRRENGNACAKR
jgi:hypothetical protein